MLSTQLKTKHSRNAAEFRASSFLGLSADSTSIQMGVIIVNMVLVVVLTWIDTLYQNTQGIAAVRAQDGTIFLKGEVNTHIFDQTGIRHMSWILPAIQSGSLVALFLLGEYATLQQAANAELDRSSGDNTAFALSTLSKSIQGSPGNNDTQGSQNQPSQQVSVQQNSYVIAFILQKQLFCQIILISIIIMLNGWT